MELVFEAQSIDYLRPVFTKAAAQEQTQELIVPADPQSEGEGDLDDLHLPPYAGNF